MKIKEKICVLGEAALLKSPPDRIVSKWVVTPTPDGLQSRKGISFSQSIIIYDDINFSVVPLSGFFFVFLVQANYKGG